jgi:hypothetical protein
MLFFCVCVPENQASSIEPRTAKNDDPGRPAIQVVQQKRSGAERRSILTWQRWISAEEDPGVVWVNRTPHFHHDHVTALCLAFEDLLEFKLTMRHTLGSYLDATLGKGWPPAKT